MSLKVLDIGCIHAKFRNSSLHFDKIMTLFNLEISH